MLCIVYNESSIAVTGLRLFWLFCDFTATFYPQPCTAALALLVVESGGITLKRLILIKTFLFSLDMFYQDSIDVSASSPQITVQCTLSERDSVQVLDICWTRKLVTKTLIRKFY